MEKTGVLTITLIIINGLVTYQGLKEPAFFNKFSFSINRVLGGKDYKRLITSGFLHADWIHFMFNMITLYLFSDSIEAYIGMQSFIILYFVSLLGGNLLALYIHRNHPDYTAIGASGAVSGLVFAAIGLFPDIEIGFIFIPYYIPAWLYGIGYVLYSIYGIKSQKDNIGHEAHLGGGIVGLLTAILLQPDILFTNYLPIALILIPVLIFLFLILKKPHLLIFDRLSAKPKGMLTVEDKYNFDEASKQTELDILLDKVSKKGYENLSKSEKEKLHRLSQ